MKIYLAIDPGKATGIAWLASYPDFQAAEPHFHSDIIESERWDVEDLVANACWRYGRDLTVIIESWEVRKNTFTLSNQEDPRYIIGAVEYICRRNATPYIEQTSGQMKKFANTPVEFHKIRRLGWHSPGEGHDNDAAGHLITYLSTLRHEDGDWFRKRLVEVLR